MQAGKFSVLRFQQLAFFHPFIVHFSLAPIVAFAEHKHVVEAGSLPPATRLPLAASFDDMSLSFGRKVIIMRAPRGSYSHCVACPWRRQIDKTCRSIYMVTAVGLRRTLEPNPWFGRVVHHVPSCHGNSTSPRNAETDAPTDAPIKELLPF